MKVVSKLVSGTAKESTGRSRKGVDVNEEIVAVFNRLRSVHERRVLSNKELDKS